MVLEIGYDQGEAVKNLALQTFPNAEVTVKPDLAGIDRVVTIQT
jgi:methylase of polypeptide subunit release factors